MTSVCDFSDQAIDLRAVAQAGFTGIISYASSYGGKNLTQANMDLAEELGLAVGAVCEEGAQQAMVPANAPRDAEVANAWLDSIGYDPGAALYVVANDPNQIAPSTFPTVEEYFTLYAEHSPRMLGGYGERSALIDLMTKGLIRYGWGVESWGGGAGLHLLQMVNNVDTHGLPIDVDTVLQADWGQHPRPAPAPTKGQPMLSRIVEYKAGQRDYWQVSPAGDLYHKYSFDGGKTWHSEPLPSYIKFNVAAPMVDDDPAIGGVAVYVEDATAIGHVYRYFQASTPPGDQTWAVAEQP